MIGGLEHLVLFVKLPNAEEILVASHCDLGKLKGFHIELLLVESWVIDFFRYFSIPDLLGLQNIVTLSTT